MQASTRARASSRPQYRASGRGVIRRTTHFRPRRLRTCPSVGPASSSATGCSCCSCWLAALLAGGSAARTGSRLSSRTRSPSRALTPNAPGNPRAQLRRTCRRRLRRRLRRRPALRPRRARGRAPPHPARRPGGPDGPPGHAPSRRRRPLRRTSTPRSTCSTRSATPTARPPIARGQAARRATSPASPAIQRDLDRVFSGDLRRGQAIALAVALARAGCRASAFSLAVAIPFVFAACTIAATLAIVCAVAHYALDGRLRDEPRRADRARARDRLLPAHRPTASARRSAGARGAGCSRPHDGDRRPLGGLLRRRPWPSGLALLLFMPVPFIRSMGIGGLLIPLVVDRGGPDAAAGAALVLSGAARSLARAPRRQRSTTALWARLARTIMRRPCLFLSAGTAVLVALAAPAASHRADARLLLERSRADAAVAAGSGSFAMASARAPSRPRRSSSTPALRARGRCGGPRARSTAWGTGSFSTPRRCSSPAGESPPYVDRTRPLRPRDRRRTARVGRDGDAALRPRAARDRLSPPRASRPARGLRRRRTAAGSRLSRTAPTTPSPGSCSASLVAHLPRPPAGVPLAPAAVEGGAAEPADGGSGLRAARRRLPVGHRRRPARRGPGDQIEGWIPIFLFATSLRALDGLRGLRRLAHARGRGTTRATTRARSRSGSSAPAGS